MREKKLGYRLPDKPWEQLEPLLPKRKRSLYAYTVRERLSLAFERR